ncbi:translation initiation factor IF-2, partial [Candidatus Woesearchaeota archaeon]|nr:translation initiation factor IF-2 [Candidatus Woesearchaeota archaeon]
IKVTIPGMLAIDTPGHAAFTSLRKRGGNLADIAIVVVDINEGFKPQTEEAIEFLRESKTPFVIAANKIDLISGWKQSKQHLLQSINSQQPQVQKVFEGKMYSLVGQLHEKFQMNSERFDRISDYTQQIAIVPVSAKTGEGLPELLMVMTGMAQKYLEECLKCNLEGPAKGTVLEVKEEKGLGKTMDVIIYDGHLKANDQIVIGNIGEPIVAKVKAMFEPAPLSEMRTKKAKFKSVKEVSAATGVKISAPGTDEAIAGMPIVSVYGDIEKAKEEVQKEIEEVLIETDKSGIVIKADSLGSLEAMINMLRERKIPINKAMVGDITKKDLIDAESMKEKDPLLSVVLGFNVKLPEELKSENVKVITSQIIYEIIEKLEKWQVSEKKRQEAKVLENLVQPCKIEILKGYIFRQSNPAVVGIHVLEGVVAPDTPLMNRDGELIASVKSIQAEQKNVDKAEKGQEVAVSLPNVTVGRQINEGDILISAIPEQDFRKFKEHKHLLEGPQKSLLKEIAEIMRRKNAVWGV